MNEYCEPSSGGAPIDFWVDVEVQRDTVTIIPAGELDIATVGELEGELDDLIEAGFGRIVIDLRGVEFIDSTGLHTLLEAHERAKDEDWQFAIVPGRHVVQQLFEITGTVDHLPFTPSTNGAGNSDPGNSRLPHRPYDPRLAPSARGRPLADPTFRTDQ